MDAPSEGMTCNCSICGRAGWVLAFVPATQFELRTGHDLLTDYQFGKKHIHHTFCSRCGVRTHSHAMDPASGTDTVALNLRCVAGLDVSALSLQPFDGAAL